MEPRRVALLALLALGAAPPPALAAQATGTIVGIVVGQATTTQIWKPPKSTEKYSGLVLGAYADAATPRSWLSVRAEGSLTQRGGDVALQVDGQPVLGSMRMDYLTIAVHVKLTRSLGPLRAHVALGPTLDQLLRSRLDPLLAQALDEETPTVFGVAAGGGIGMWVTDRIFAELDVRLTEGLSDAYDGAFTRVRNRSVEGLLRVGIPLSILRGT
jgi:hypothetical protein